MTRKYIIVADDSLKGFNEEIENLERKWGAEEIEPCEDCFSRQAAIDIKTIAPIAPVMNGEAVHYEEVVFVHDLEKLPSVTPQPKTGRWIKTYEPNDAEPFILWKCECCGLSERIKTHYCPNCGAKMEVSE